MITRDLQKEPSGAVTVTVSGSNQHSESVLDWREHQFKRMGFAEYVAAALAMTRIDLHQMEQLLAQGCPHHLAAEIMMGTMWSGEDPHWDDPEEQDAEEEVNDPPHMIV